MKMMLKWLKVNLDKGMVFLEEVKFGFLDSLRVMVEMRIKISLIRDPVTNNVHFLVMFPESTLEYSTLVVPS